MKCLTIQQPWASLTAVGAKKFETRFVASKPPRHPRNSRRTATCQA
jgi:hypothetical protein